MEVSDIKAIEHRLESIESILRMLLFNSVFTDNEIENTNTDYFTLGYSGALLPSVIRYGHSYLSDSDRV